MNAQVLSNAQIADTLFLITLRPDGAFSFKAGQFVIIPLPAESPQAKPAKGFYSIASAEQDSTALELLVEHRPDGGYISRSMSAVKAGDSLSLEGPLGKFSMDGQGSGPVAFAGYKAGLAPLRSMLLSHLKSGSAREAWLFLGGEPLFDGEWKALAARHSHFHYLPQADPAADMARHLLGKNPEIYAAGFNKEVEPIQAGLLAAGFEKTCLHVEKFG